MTKMVNVVHLSSGSVGTNIFMYIIPSSRLDKVRGDALLKDGPDDDQKESSRTLVPILISFSVTLLVAVGAQIRAQISFVTSDTVQN